MVVTCQEMQQAEEDAFAAGASAAELMEAAGCGIAAAIRQFHSPPGTLVLYLGKGNNAGDALVAARELLTDGWRLLARLAVEPSAMKELPARHLAALADQIEVVPDASISRLFGSRGKVLLLDGLLGIGASGPLQGRIHHLAEEMNEVRRRIHGVTVAMDIPSGLHGDIGAPQDGCVRADLTVTVGCVKAGLLADSATAFVGRLALVPLEGLNASHGDASRVILQASDLRDRLPVRCFDMHKGQAGRVAVLAGSPGFLGAAALACQGAVRAGAGLVTLFACRDAYPLLAARVSSEIMVRPVEDYREVLDLPFDALAIGPGLGFGHEAEVLEVIRKSPLPTVIDADALTMVARPTNRDALKAPPGARLLTPHPGEMARLIEGLGWEDQDRAGLVSKWIAAHPGCTLLLKGARTVIAASGRPLSFNSTGHPGMATGGMGDVLTGVCAALLAQGIDTPDAASLGAWLCGRAAELAVSTGRVAPESVTAGDVAALLGNAIDDLKRAAF